MYIVIAIIIFSLIVMIHELGHFSLAKANHVEVTEFSLGMGPRIFTWVKTEKGVLFKLFASTSFLEGREDCAGHTWYSVKCLPFGGSCMMLGEEDAVESENAFNKKSVYARMAVIFAGPFFNFVFAFILALFVIGFNGYDPANITGVVQGGAMEQAGIQKGDLITSINGRHMELNREVGTYFQLYPLDGSPVKFTVERNGQTIEKSVTPQQVEDSTVYAAMPSLKSTNKAIGKKTYRLGFEYLRERKRTDVVQTIKYAAYEVKFWIFTTVESLGSLIKGSVSPKEISGPVGIVSIIKTGGEQSESYGFASLITYLLNISILITANLGVMNLLPIPALDGGRLLFLIIEWIRRKPLNQKFENGVNFVGFALLMLLMVVILFNDILKLI